MKKIIALVLALVMTLSLLPMNAWAVEGTETEYKQLYWGDGPETNLTYNSEFKGDASKSYNFRCFTEQRLDALITESGGYTLTTEGNVGTFTANANDCTWNLTSATDAEGYLRVEKENTVYRMKVTINNGRNVFTYQGVDIYTAYDNGNLSYGDWSYDDLSLTINGGNGISMLVPCGTDTEAASVYLKPAAGLRLVLPEWRQSNTTLSAADANGVYVLTHSKLSENTSVQVFNGEQYIGEIDLMFVPRDGSGDHGGGGDEEEFVEVFEIGNTLVKIRNLEGQSNVLNFEKIVENGVPTIVAAIKTDSPEAWRTVTTREDGLGVRFEIAAKEGEPNVKVHIADRETEDLAQDLADWGADTSYLAYNDPHERNRGGEYATAVYDEDKGETSILATTSVATYGCFWKYSESDVRADGFVFKIVIADSELEFPVVVPDAAFVTTNRITAIPHAALDNLIQLKKSGDYVACENGKVTYASAYPINAENYAAFTAAVAAAVTTDGIGTNLDGDPMYNLLHVTTPEEGYVAKSYKGRFTALREYSDNSTAMDLEYMWNGFGCEQVYTLTWKHETDANQPDIVEKLTIVTPSNPDLKWMDMIGQRIPDDGTRVTYTALPADCGAAISYSNGTITTTFDNNAVLDVAPILESFVTITVPTLNGRKAVAVKYAGEDSIMEDPADPTLTEFTATLIDRFKGAVDDGNELNVQELDAVYVPLGSLEEQVYGKNGEIKYFYSTHDGNRFSMLKWFFPNDNNDATPDVLYEYMEIEATPYYCQWVTDLSTELSDTPVNKPSAEVDTNANLSNIKLVTRIHPQGKEHGQYFFEMSVVDEGEGNTFIETYTGGYTIVLPYSFIGVENRAAAEATGKKAMINHYKNDGSFTLKDNNGTIFGTFTDRGIEFTVTDFSPFTVGLVEDDTGGGGDGTGNGTGGNTSTGGDTGGNTGTGTGGNVGGNTGNIGGGTSTSGTSGSTTTTTVEPNKTFDAGIALYGAMAVLAATGSAVVIGKKRKN